MDLVASYKLPRLRWFICYSVIVLLVIFASLNKPVCTCGSYPICWHITCSRSCNKWTCESRRHCSCGDRSTSSFGCCCDFSPDVTHQNLHNLTSDVNIAQWRNISSYCCVDCWWVYSQCKGELFVIKWWTNRPTDTVGYVCAHGWSEHVKVACSVWFPFSFNQFWRILELLNATIREVHSYRQDIWTQVWTLLMFYNLNPQTVILHHGQKQPCWNALLELPMIK